MLKYTFYFFLKLLFLYLSFGLYTAVLILIDVGMPLVLFVAEPFIHVSSAVIILGAIVSLKIRSMAPLLWTVFWALFAVALLHIPLRYVGIFISIFLFAGAINYLYRNKFTEPLLVFLPIIAGALFLIQPVYNHYLGVWAYFETGVTTFAGYSAKEIVVKMVFQSLLVVPIFVLYFLGKRSYLKLSPLFQRSPPG
jgi:hypothetical protein